MQKTIKLEPNEIDFEVVLCSALRYALHRQTYVVGCVTNTIKHYLPALSMKTLAVIYRDIQEAKNYAEKLGTTIGADFDEAEWMKLASLVQAEYNSRHPKIPLG